MARQTWSPKSKRAVFFQLISKVRKERGDRLDQTRAWLRKIPLSRPPIGASANSPHGPELDVMAFFLLDQELKGYVAGVQGLGLAIVLHLLLGDALV